MFIDVPCPHCKAVNHIDENMGGKTVACATCGQPIYVGGIAPDAAAQDNEQIFDIVEEQKGSPVIPKEQHAAPAAKRTIAAPPLAMAAQEIEHGGKIRNFAQEAWQEHQIKRRRRIGFFVAQRNEGIVDAVIIVGGLAFPLVMAAVYMTQALQESFIRFLGVTLGWLVVFGILAGIVGPITNAGIKLADRRRKGPTKPGAYWRIMGIIGLLTGGYMIGDISGGESGKWLILLPATILVAPFLFVYLFRTETRHFFSRAWLAASFALFALIPAMVVMLIFGRILGPFLSDFRPPRNLVMSLFFAPPPEPKTSLPDVLDTEFANRPGAETNQTIAEKIPAAPSQGAQGVNPGKTNSTTTTGISAAATGNIPETIAIPRNINELTDEMVVAAMTRAASRLLTDIKRDEILLQSSHENRDRLQGEVALATYALLATGRCTGDERLHGSSEDMMPLVKTVVNMQSDYLYTMALQISALGQLPRRPEYRLPIKQIADRLVAGLGPYAGYSYRLLPFKQARDPSNTTWDNSNTQYGILGVWAATDAGVDIPIQYWRLAEQHWRRSQMPSGGWYYNGGYLQDMKGKPIPDTGAPEKTASTTMTAAGVASLLAIMERMGGPLRLEPAPDPMLDAGLSQVAQDYMVNSADIQTNLYYAYGVERVGLASGYKYLGKINWYRDGAVRLLTRQDADGSWSYVDNKIVGTAYGLLFLARGRNAVVFNKLQYDGPWNARLNDSAHLANWLSKRTEQSINWQVVNYEVEPEDWLDAPILLITGHKDPKFSLEQIVKLQRFIRAGGTILSSADGGEDAFTTAIRDKYAPAVVDGQYAMRELPANHPIYTIEAKLHAKDNPLLGLSNGVRELWVHSPIDLGATWQSNSLYRDGDWLMSENLFLYVTGKASLRTKLQPLTVPEPAVKPNQTANLVRLKYDGAWDPEPGAWPRMARLAPLLFHSNLHIEAHRIIEINAAVTHGVHMTGTTAFALSQDDALRLKSFIKAHGIVLSDAAGGSPEFAHSFRQLMESMFPNVVVAPLPSDHPLLAGTMPGGMRIDPLEYRKYVYRGNRPDILEFKVGGRTIAILAEGDITSGLLGTNTWGIQGYTPKTAQQLAWNMVVLAASPMPTPVK